MRTYFSLLVVLVALVLLSLTASSSSKTFTENHHAHEIAVLVPAEHKAMESIIAGLSEQLEKELGKGSIRLSIYRAYGESTLMQSALQQIRLSKAKIVLPIGTAATLLTLHQMDDRPVIHLAAKLSNNERRSSQFSGKDFAGVLDEVGPERLLQQALQIAPFKKIALIHSATEKAYPEAKAFAKEAQIMGIDLQVLVAGNCSEVYSASRHLKKDRDLIFILKDHLIVSALPCLLEAANSMSIPLMASDEDSVANGAHMALAVKEREIGRQAALLCRDLLEEKKLHQLPIIESSSPTLFYNRVSMERLSNTEVLDFFIRSSGAVDVSPQENNRENNRDNNSEGNSNE